MEVLRCPVCSVEWRGASVTLDDHVNAHFDAEAGQDRDARGPQPRHTGSSKVSSQAEDGVRKGDALNGPATGGGVGPSEGSDVCFVCGCSLCGMDVHERNEHANSCLDEQDGNGEAEQATAAIPTAKPIMFQRHKGDIWWSPVDGNLQKIPANYSPGVIVVLLQILQKAYQQGITKQAVLCHDGAVHIRGASGFDMGWGCGYRNCLMAISALLIAYPQYRTVFPSLPVEIAPGVGQLQTWMDGGWREGYDEIGNRQMKGKIVGTRKWIGTSDLYAMLSRLGIPCKLYDFPRPPASSGPKAPTAHGALINFVRTYFDDTAYDTPSLSSHPASAFDMLMRSDGNAASRNIRVTEKMPLILQHAGHSRTVIGYEVNSEGNTNLLLFDPGKTMASDLRSAGIAAAQGMRNKDSPSSATSADGERGKKRGNEVGSIPPAKRRAKGSNGALHEDEKLTKGGWIKKKVLPFAHRGPADWESKPAKALGPFRVNLGAINRNAEYQILMFTGDPLLTGKEREARKRCSSIALYK